MELHFHNRASVDLARPRDVVRHAAYDNRARDKRTVIHIGRRDRKHRRPETEEGQNDEIDASANIVENANSTRNAPWSPRVRLQTRGTTNVTIRVVTNVASNAAIQEQAAGHEVRGVKPLEDQGDYVVESGRAPDIDQAQERCEYCHDRNGHQGDRGPGINLGGAHISTVFGERALDVPGSGILSLEGLGLARKTMSS